MKDLNQAKKIDNLLVGSLKGHSGVRMLKHKRERKMAQKREEMLKHMNELKDLRKQW
jgi:hypothetical protein